jgi:starch phosphorylase
MIREIAEMTGVLLSENIATIGFARRAAVYKRYKRADLRFTDLAHFVFGGKAHPRDEDGKAVIQRVFEAVGALRDAIPVV